MSGTDIDIGVLFSANLDQVEKAEKQVHQIGQRVEKNPLKVTADTKGAVASMDRVETAAKKLVSERAVVKLDADIERAEKQLQRATDRLEDLHVRAEGGLEVTADVKRAETQLARLEKHLEGLRTARSNIEVEADTSAALADLGRVESAAKRLVSQETAVRVNANVREAESAIKDLEADLDYLRSLEGTVQVDADVRQAEAKLEGARAALRELQGARAEMVVDVNEGGAKQKLKGVADLAGDVGDDAGSKLGNNLIGALVAIPIVGAVAGLGKAAADAVVDAFNDGLQVEVRQDRLEALTGINAAAAARVARGAGEAYANVFGESIEANMDTARLALQFDLIDADATSRDAQKVVESLSGISDVLGEDVQPIARATTQAIRTGLVSSAEEFFDVLATGAREGVNISEDLLDTFIEYSTHFRDLGLTADEALGLLNQGLEGGAFNADKVADALKELTIRVKEGSAPLSELGLDADQMAQAFSEGGPAARQGLEQILTALQQVEDPAERARLAVEIFGTQAEDMAGALGNLDLSTAVAQLGQVEGAAQRMFDTLASNDATKIEQAGRNIEVALDGIKGALAGAFSDPLADVADWVSQNRGEVLQFFSDLVNGAIDFAITANTALGEFVSGPLAAAVEGVATLIAAFNWGQRPKELDDLAESMRGFSETTDTANGVMEEMRGKWDQFIDPQIQLGHLNAAALRTADALAQVGVGADGATLSLDGMDLANLSATESGRQLEGQIKAGVSALETEIATAIRAGESQDDLTGRYNTGTAALAAQLVQMGLTEDEAYNLISAYGAIPETESTDITSNASERIVEIDGLAYKVTTLPDGSVEVVAHTADAEAKIDNAARDRWSTIHVQTVQQAKDLYSSYRGNFFDQGKPKAFYQGEFLSGIYKGVLGGIHKFSELEMGVPWEAFISGREADRERNIRITREVAGRLGMLDIVSPPSPAAAVSGGSWVPGSPPPELMGSGGLTGLSPVGDPSTEVLRAILAVLASLPQQIAGEVMSGIRLGSRSEIARAAVRRR